MEERSGTDHNKRRYGIIAACAAAVLAVAVGAYWLGRASGGGGDIGEEAAKLAALGHAQVSEAGLTRYAISRDERSGRPVYEVEFTADGVAYDYEIGAADGSIVSFQRERDGDAAAPAADPAVQPSAGTDPAGDIGEDGAREAALGHAGVAAADAQIVKSKQDYEDGVLVYELEFYAGGYEYEYEIRASDGAVLKSGRDLDGRPQAASGTAPAGTSAQPSAGSAAGDTAQAPAASGTAGDIGEDGAREAALRHAGVAAADAQIVKSKRDYEDGVPVYELEFYAGGYEYEYEIRASDGAVLKSERDLDGRAPAGQTSAAQPSAGQTASGDASPAYIGEARARELAYAWAGVAAGDVLRCEVELDHHDGGHHSGHGSHHAAGCCRYEIDFHCGGYEYDCEVDAVTGEILKSQREVDD